MCPGAFLCARLCDHCWGHAIYDGEALVAYLRHHVRLLDAARCRCPFFFFILLAAKYVPSCPVMPSVFFFGRVTL